MRVVPPRKGSIKKDVKSVGAILFQDCHATAGSLVEVKNELQMTTSELLWYVHSTDVTLVQELVKNVFLNAFTYSLSLVQIVETL